MKELTKCVLCDPQKMGMPWPSKYIDGLKFLMDNRLLCNDHSLKVKNQIEKQNINQRKSPQDIGE